MRRVIYTDDEGVRRISVIRDNDPDSEAEFGLPVHSPNILELDWEAMALELQNLIVDRGLLTTQDVMDKKGQLRNAIQLVVGRKIKALYLQEA